MNANKNCYAFPSLFEISKTIKNVIKTQTHSNKQKGIKIITKFLSTNSNLDNNFIYLFIFMTV